MLTTLFNKLGAQALYVAPSVQEAAAVSMIHYGQHVLRLLGA